jgi:hypothetical protein
VVDLEQPLTDRAGEAIVTPEGDTLTLGTVLRLAIDTPGPDDSKLDLATKLRIYRLGAKLKGACVDLTSDDVSCLLTRVAALFPSVLVIGRVAEILDPARLTAP